MKSRIRKAKPSNWPWKKPNTEAGRARRQYDAADPENRLVAAELENRWNAALVQVAGLESRLAAECRTDHSLTESQKERLTTLGTDPQALRNEASTPVDLKKRVLRTVIHEVVVDVNHDSGHVEMKIHWAGGVHTPWRVRKNQIGTNSNATASDIVELVRELAKGWNDGYIASMLNRSGLLTGKETPGMKPASRTSGGRTAFPCSRSPNPAPRRPCRKPPGCRVSAFA